MKTRMLKIASLAMLISGSVYAEFSSSDFSGLSGLANENAASLMNLTTKECARLDGGKCYGVVVDTDESNPPEIEYADNWINRTQVEE